MLIKNHLIMRVDEEDEDVRRDAIIRSCFAISLESGILRRIGCCAPTLRPADHLLWRNATPHLSEYYFLVGTSPPPGSRLLSSFRFRFSRYRFLVLKRMRWLVSVAL